MRKDALRTLARRHAAGRAQDVDLAGDLKEAARDPDSDVRDLARRPAREA